MPGFGPLGSYPLGGSGPDSSDAIVMDLEDTAAGVTAMTNEILPRLSDSLLGSDLNEAWIWPSIADAITTTDAADPDVLANLISRLATTGSIQLSALLSGDASDSVTFIDTVRAAWALLLEEELATAGTAAGAVRKIAALADAMAATGQAQGNVRALAAIVEAVAMEGLIVQGFTPNLVDSATLTDATMAVAKILLPAVDGLLVSDSAAPMMRISAVAADGVEFDGVAAAILRANADLADSVVLYVVIRIDGQDYTGWVLNTQAMAASQHANAAFDSFETFKGKDYGAGPGGLIEFTGTDDDGEDITWSLRTFLTDFGTGKFKRIPYVYIGARTDGQLVVKVITREPLTGVLEETWYRVERSPAEGPGTGRAKVGKGLKSTWWAVELTNVAGADLELNSIELRPLILDRRI